MVVSWSVPQTAQAQPLLAKTEGDLVLAIRLKVSSLDHHAKIQTFEVAPRLALKFNKEAVIRMDSSSPKFVSLKILPTLTPKGDVKIRIAVQVALDDGREIARSVTLVTPMGRTATMQSDDERLGETFRLKVTPSPPQAGLTGN